VQGSLLVQVRRNDRKHKSKGRTMDNKPSRLSGLRIKLLLLFAIVPVAVAYYVTRPDPGLTQLQLSRDAVHKARSWHSHEVVKGPGDMIAHEETKDVSCPSKNRSDYRIETSFQRPDALRYGQAQHSKIDMSISGVHYSRIDDGPWDSYVGGMFLQDCNGMPIVHDSKLYFDADIVIATGKMRRIGHLRVDSESCTEWEVSWDRTTPRYTVCINEADHLPRRITLDSGRWTMEFSAWNAPPSLVAPI